MFLVELIMIISADHFQWKTFSQLKLTSKTIFDVGKKFPHRRRL